MNISEDVVLGQLIIGLLAYVYDIVNLGDNMETVKRLCKKLMEVAG